MSSVADTACREPQVGPERSSARKYSIGRVAVLGAGTMGARIAAHIANAGLPVLLLDLVPASGDRNGLAMTALATLKKGKPAAFAASASAALVSVGNFEDDLERLVECDWVIEAVAENLEIKRTLLASVTKHLHATAILTTNTSGLPVAKIAELLPKDVRRRWLGAHFFNPLRYMRLLEVIPTAETDLDAMLAISEFGDRQLGKEAVPAKDIENFIANRLGTFSMLNTFKIMEEQRLTIEEVDVLTGTPIGWPKSGTFRLSDMVGIDVLANVAWNFKASASDERSDVELPQLISQLIERQWLGDKTKQGFYKRALGAEGEELRLVLNPGTLQYEAVSKVSFPSIEQSKSIEDLPMRLRSLLAGGLSGDKAARFYWRALPELWAYAANRIGEVSETLVDIDRAMVAGFNWERGPFAMWDAAGVTMVVEKMRELEMPIPLAVEKLLGAGGESWYSADGAEYFDVSTGAYRAVKQSPEHASIANHERSNGIFAGNADVSLVDIGDGIGCFELHSKMNSLGTEIVLFLGKQLQAGSDAVRNFDGFVLSTDASNFSVGANLLQLMLAIQDQKWDDVARTLKEFQAMTQAVKFCSRPVVSAVAGMCLGGGCELALHSAGRQPHLELYAGLVETRVGLIPGGGGARRCCCVRSRMRGL
jgi:3-hydroxyacyl-CoA dehydrogenase